MICNVEHCQRADWAAVSHRYVAVQISNAPRVSRLEYLQARATPPAIGEHLLWSRLRSRRCSAQDALGRRCTVRAIVVHMHHAQAEVPGDWIRADVAVAGIRFAARSRSVGVAVYLLDLSRGAAPTS